MDFIFQFLEQLGPLGGAGWGLAMYFLKLLFDAKKDAEVRDDAADAAKAALMEKIQELTEKHGEIMLAASESRVDDLKLLVAKYDSTVKVVTSALEKLNERK